jgi:aryl-alcohol dehydrogenase-like predicted oxidoreductase
VISTRKLAIGTAQWGLDYGTTNTSGRLEDSVVQCLLDSMRANDISHLDTATSYGDSELRIGNLETSGIHIQTKLSAKGRTIDDLNKKFHESLERLKRNSVDSLLIHDWFALDQIEAESVNTFFQLSMNEGLTQRVGISAYDLSDLNRADHVLSMWSTAQIPINVLDQRFISAHENFPEVAFQARSIFLQGLLLAPQSKHPDVIKFHASAQAQDTDPLSLCVQFINSQTWLDSVIIAPTSIAEFNQILRAMSSEEIAVDFNQLTSTDVRLLDPRTWN